MKELLTEIFGCSFEGRIGRSKFFVYRLVLMAFASAVVGILNSLGLALKILPYSATIGKPLAAEELGVGFFAFFVFVMLPFCLYLFVMWLSFLSRRAHDFSWSGPRYFFFIYAPIMIVCLFIMITFIGSLFNNAEEVDMMREKIGFILLPFYFIWIFPELPLFLRKSTPAPNQFGDEPKGLTLL